MSRTTLGLLVMLAVIVLTSGARPRFNFNFKPEPPRHRVDVQAQGSARNRGNYDVAVGARAEYDIHRAKNGAKVVGYAEGSHGFGRYEGKSYQGKPQGEVGVRVEVPLGAGR